MDTQYGFFNLYVALDSVRKTKNEPPAPQRNSVGVVPEIDYSLLRSVLGANPTNPEREFQFVVLQGGLSTRHSRCGQQLNYSPN
ncbi:MAG: hypothetical protein JO308_12700 [Verrucomicrobia bacterium]|nr:hypothetical protein [Verrucomicrobiota bacterium]